MKHFSYDSHVIALCAQKVLIKDRLLKEERYVSMDSFVSNAVEDKELPWLAVANAAGEWARCAILK